MKDAITFSSLRSQTDSLLLCTVDRMGLLISDALTHSLCLVFLYSSLSFMIFLVCFLNPSHFLICPSLFPSSVIPLLSTIISLFWTNHFLFPDCSFSSFASLPPELHLLHSSYPLHPFSLATLPLGFFFLTLLAAPLATPSCEGLLLQDNAVSAEIRALLSSYYNDRWSNRSRALYKLCCGCTLPEDALN